MKKKKQKPKQACVKNNNNKMQRRKNHGLCSRSRKESKPYIYKKKKKSHRSMKIHLARQSCKEEIGIEKIKYIYKWPFQVCCKLPSIIYIYIICGLLFSCKNVRKKETCKSIINMKKLRSVLSYFFTIYNSDALSKQDCF